MPMRIELSATEAGGLIEWLKHPSGTKVVTRGLRIYAARDGGLDVIVSTPAASAGIEPTKREEAPVQHTEGPELGAARRPIAVEPPEPIHPALAETMRSFPTGSRVVRRGIGSSDVGVRQGTVAGYSRNGESVFVEYDGEDFGARATSLGLLRRVPETASQMSVRPDVDPFAGEDVGWSPLSDGAATTADPRPSWMRKHDLPMQVAAKALADRRRVAADETLAALDDGIINRAAALDAIERIYR